MCGFARLEIERVYYIFPVSFLSLDIFAELSHSRLVVSSVDEEIGSEVLESPWVINLPECLLDDSCIDSEQYSSIVGNTSIGYLMISEKVGHHCSLSCKQYRRSSIVRDSLKCWIFTIEQYRDSGLDDASLFSCDLLESITEELHMII
jgi:hypothetical protein